MHAVFTLLFPSLQWFQMLICLLALFASKVDKLQLLFNIGPTCKYICTQMNFISLKFTE